MAGTTMSTGSALRELAALTLQARTVHDLAEQASKWATRVIPGASTVSVLISWHHTAVTAAAADVTGRELISLSHGSDAPIDATVGPARQAVGTQQVVASTDLKSEHRWGRWARDAFDAGIGSVYAYPMSAGHSPIGALTIYAAKGDPLSLATRRWAGDVAGMVTVALVAAQRDFDHTGLVEDLRTALARRPVIDQAIGVLLARNGGDADSALSGLRRASQRRNVPVRDLAAALVASTSRRPEGGPMIRRRMDLRR